jgi:hypothetical protein
MRKTLLAGTAALGLIVAVGAAKAAILIPTCGWVFGPFGPVFVCN